MKRTIPLLICGFAGFAILLSYFSPQTSGAGEHVAIWFDVLAAMAFVLGGGNLLFLHLKKVSDQRQGWAYSGIILIAFFTTLYVGLVKFGVHPNPKHPLVAYSGSYREEGAPFWWLYEYAFKPLTATMFAMLAFYVASAAFRAFRAKNIEAILLLGTAFIILLGRTFAGAYLTGWFPEEINGLKIDNLTVYIMSVVNTAGNRAIMIGIALGLVSTSLKMLLGVDRSYLGSGEE